MAALRPRTPVLHDRSAVIRPKKGVRARVQLAAEKKEWRDRRAATEESREARVAAGIEDDVAEAEEEAILSAPPPADPSFTSSNVKMKLATFCGNADVRRVLNSVVLHCNVMMAEAYAFANLHVTRVLEQGLAPPEVGPKFYDACLSAVTSCRTTASKFDQGMKDSISVFDGLRPCGALKIESSKLSDIRSELCIGMAAMAANHLWLNLAGRLSKYLVWRHPEVTKALRKTVVECVAMFPTMKLSTVAKLSFETAKGKDFGEGRRAAIRTAVELIERLRARCPLKGTGAASRAHELLPLYHDMMKDTEAACAAARDGLLDDKTARRVRKARFSLLPNKNGFTVGHVPICGRALMGVLVRVRNADGTPLVRTKGTDSGHDSAWRKFFNVNGIETRERMFGGRIATDGVSVSAYMEREQACVLSTKQEEWDAKRVERQNKGKLEVVYAGVDPGLTDVVTVAHTTDLQNQTDEDDKSVRAKVQSYSASRYAEESRQKASKRRTEAWNEETSDSVARIDHASDRSTSFGLETFIRSYLGELRTLLNHRAERGYRNWRFHRYVFKQRAVSDICDLIAPPGKFSVVGYGDWSGPNGTPIKRRWAGPQQDIKRELQHRPNVLFRSVWEYRTSVTCHATWRKLTNMRARSWKYDRTIGEKVLSETRSSVHKVLHCRSSDGAKGRPGGGTWNRDANASRNMLMLLMLEVLGVERPKEFMPAVTVHGRRKQRTKGASPRPAKTLSSPPQGTEGKEVAEGYTIGGLGHPVEVSHFS